MSSSDVHFDGIDARRLGDLLVVVDHAVDVDGDRDLEHLAVDGDGVEHGLRERLGGADLVEQRPERLALAALHEVAEDVGFRGDEGVGRRAGDDQADQRALAGGLMRGRGGDHRVAARP